MTNALWTMQQRRLQKRQHKLLLQEDERIPGSWLLELIGLLDYEGIATGGVVMVKEGRNVPVKSSSAQILPTPDP